MIKILVVLALLASTQATAQNLFRSQKSSIKFFSDAIIEDIEGVNGASTAVLNLETGEVAVLMKIKDFVFHKAAMRTHFNESYMESDRYPTASFKGRAPGKIQLKKGSAPVVIKFSGDLTLHGVTLPRDIAVTLQWNEKGAMVASAKFSIRVADHKIKIPSLVFKNIAEVVEVTSDYIMVPMSQ